MSLRRRVYVCEYTCVLRGSGHITTTLHCCPQWCSVNTAISSLTARESKTSELQGKERDDTYSKKSAFNESEKTKAEIDCELEWLLQRRHALLNLGGMCVWYILCRPSPFTP